VKIISLEVEKFKRIKAARITPDGNVVTIGGKNGAGKTSILDAIEVSLCGKASAPAEPVRRGEDQARIVIDLDDIVVKRTFQPGGKSSLVVESADGAKFPSPQAMLQKLYGKLSFDPLAFTRMDPKKQLQTLRDLLGLDFADLDARRRKAFEERTDVNRDAKAIEAQIADIPASKKLPKEPVDVSALLHEHQQGVTTNRRNELAKATANGELNQLNQVRRQLEEARANVARLERMVDSQQEVYETALAETYDLKDVDLSTITARIAEANQVNAKIAEAAERAKKEEKLRQLTMRSNELSNVIEQVDAEKNYQVASAKFPVAGMSFDENGVLLNDLPFEQASAAEQLRASVAMGLAMNPELRVVLVRDASLLDRDSLAMVAQMAEEANAQVWLETVSADGSGCQVLIEDGEASGPWAN
jgi:DNA repair exonuclease SbcCD ATPase subunit